MANFESGVKGYVTAQYLVKVNFPIDFKDNSEIACKHCPYLSSNERMCQLNKMPLAYPNKYVGDFCPLKPLEREEKRKCLGF